MSRFDRPPFAKAELFACLDHAPDDGDEGRNRTFFDYWCDEDDHQQLIATLNTGCYSLPTRAHRSDDPAPPITQPPAQGFRRLWLITAGSDVEHALTHPATFSNLPYAELGGGAFLLARDPSPQDPAHDQQQAFVQALLATQAAALLGEAAKRAVEQSALLALTQDEFDLAAWAGQAALRYASITFGFGFHDHPLLERSAQAAYRALQYIAIGRHFVSEPGTVPEAQRTVAALMTRISELSEAYGRLARSPRRFGPTAYVETPFGVQPLAELGLSHLGRPLLHAMAAVPSPLSGHDRAMVCAMLIAGTLGNIQTAVCQIVSHVLQPGNERYVTFFRSATEQQIADEVATLVGTLPPIAALPRRTLHDVTVQGKRIPAGDDCLLLLEPAARSSTQHAQYCHHAWGRSTSTNPHAVHACLGRSFALPVIAALVSRVLHLPGLARSIDPLTGDARAVERLWGAACTGLPLNYKRVRSRAQRNLIVSMRIKPPTAERVAQLQRLVAAAVPRIEHMLTAFEGVHFAWFEFSEDQTLLTLRTIYNGELEPYLRHFAEHAGDLFDGLFEHLEGAPPSPVSAFPEEFIAAVRRYNRAPLAGYLYSAYPDRDVAACRR